MPRSVNYHTSLIESLRKDRDLCLAYLTESIVGAFEENNIKLLYKSIRNISEAGNVDVIENFADYLKEADWIEQIDKETLKKIQKLSISSLLKP